MKNLTFKILVAIEFVVYFDTEVAHSTWLDPDRRYLRAGLIENIFRQYLRFHSLDTVRLFSQTFDVDKQVLLNALKGDDDSPYRCLNSDKIANEDRENLRFKTPKDKVWKVAAQYASKTNNRPAYSIFAEHTARFDTMFQVLSHIGLGGESIFERYHQYHTWSRWEKVLFLPRCSKVSRIPGRKEGSTDPQDYIVEEVYKASRLVSVQEEKRGQLMVQNYLNDSREFQYGAYTSFLLEVLKVLTFKNMLTAFLFQIRIRSFSGIVIRFIDGFLEWFAYAFQLCFPFTLLGFFVLLLVCY